MRAFDQLFAEAVPLIQQGLHQRDTQPIEGGRWPVSVVLRPDQASALATAELWRFSYEDGTAMMNSVKFARSRGRESLV